MRKEEQNASQRIVNTRRSTNKKRDVRINNHEPYSSDTMLKRHKANFPTSPFLISIKDKETGGFHELTDQTSLHKKPNLLSLQNTQPNLYQLRHKHDLKLSDSYINYLSLHRTKKSIQELE